MTVKEDILKVLEEVGKPLSPSKMAEYGRSNYNSIKSAVRRMEADGVVEDLGNGVYQLPSSLSVATEDSAGGEETQMLAPPEDEAAEGEVKAPIYGEANAAGDLVLEPGAGDPPREKTVSVSKWRADFGDNVPYGARGYGYWTVRGDSAAPVYFRGEDVPVRKLGPTQEFEPEGVYVFRWSGSLYLKRLFDDEGGVYAQSLNPAIRDMRFRPNNGHEFAVLGKVCSSTKQQLFVSLLGSKLEPNR